MNRPFRLSVTQTSLLVMLLSMWTAASFSEQLYRWTDEQGRVHFSDRLPAGKLEAKVETLPTPQFAAPDVPPDRYSVVQQWQRFSAERQAQKQARQEKKDREREFALRQREVAAAERAAEQAAAPSDVGGTVWLAPPYYRGGRWPGHRPGHRPGKPASPLPSHGLWKRDHPAYRPYKYRPGRHHPGKHRPGKRGNYGAEVKGRL